MCQVPTASYGTVHYLLNVLFTPSTPPPQLPSPTSSIPSLIHSFPRSQLPAPSSSSQIEPFSGERVDLWRSSRLHLHYLCVVGEFTRWHRLRAPGMTGSARFKELVSFHTPRASIASDNDGNEEGGPLGGSCLHVWPYGSCSCYPEHSELNANRC